MKPREYFLLPGPTPLPNEVLRASALPMVNHRGPDFRDMLRSVTERVKKVFKTGHEVLILTTSGSGGLETAVANFVDQGDRVIVASIGNFGERFRTIAEEYGAEVDFIDFGWGHAIDANVIRERLAADTEHRIKAVFCQHNETSTGVTNDIKAVGEAMVGHPALLIVDTVSGLGAAPFCMDEWHVDVAVAGSQKAFMAPPGLAFVAVSPRAVERLEQTHNTRFYFDLRKARDMYDKGQTPFTPAISVINAVDEALNYFDEVGVDAVVAHHRVMRDLVRAGVRGLGLELLVGDDCASPAVTAVCCPEGVNPTALRKLLRERYHIIIAGGQGKFAETTFRIGHLGAVQEMDLIAAMAGLELALTELGCQVELGAGVRAMQQQLLHR